MINKKIMYQKNAADASEKSMSREEILDVIKENIEKERSIDYLARLVGTSEFEVMGYIKTLREKGLNISYYEKDGTAYVVRNDHPDLTRENVYRIEEDYDSETKVGVISDLRFGSKCEQIAVLNEMYKKFAEEGVKYVIVAGNLIEGTYTSDELLEFGESLISNDAKAQADHLIEYFPKVEGITTLFISGINEHKCSKKLDVGKYIAENRDDMVYLGPKSCKLYFNNATFKVEQLKKGSKNYTIAYATQQYLRSMPCYEDYDAIILGGTQSEQHFPSLRDAQTFTAPAVAIRTPKMADDYVQNVSSALTLTIKYDKTGHLKKVTPEYSPYYVPVDQSYLTTPKLNIKRDGDNNLINVPKKAINSHAYFDMADKFYKSLRKEESFNSIKNRFNMTSDELFGLITILQSYGRNIEVVDIDNELVVRKHLQRKIQPEIKPPKEELTKKEFLVVSDTHIGSIYSQPSMIATSVYEAYNRGIEDIYHIGDITDGEYRTRPKHVHEVYVYGYTGELLEAIRLLPKYKGMKWHVIQGSHDETHLFNYGKVLGEDLQKNRSDIEYLGQDQAIVSLDNCKMELFHPGGGTSRILSTKPQNGIDQLDSNTKPNISLRGHYHKAYYALYRNIHTFLCPCNVDQSSFMMKNEIPNIMGNLFITIWYDDEGHIQYIKEEPMIFDQSQVREHDWEHPRKNLRSRTLVR